MLGKPWSTSARVRLSRSEKASSRSSISHQMFHRFPAMNNPAWPTRATESSDNTKPSSLAPLSNRWASALCLLAVGERHSARVSRPCRIAGPQIPAQNSSSVSPNCVRAEHRSLTTTHGDVNMAKQLTRTVQNLFVPSIPRGGEAADLGRGNETNLKHSKAILTDSMPVPATQSSAHSSVG